MDDDPKQTARDFVESFNHVFEMTYESTHAWIDHANISDYRKSSYEGTSIEVSVIDPSEVDTALSHIDASEGDVVTCNVFHDTADAEALRETMTKHGFLYQYTAPVQAIRLPAPIDKAVTIREAFNAEDVEFVNKTMNDGDRPMPEGGVESPHIRRFYALIDDNAAGWAQMVTVVPNTAYIGEMYTLPDYRNQGVAKALLSKIHEEAHAIGYERVILVPSNEANRFYIHHGYKDVVFYSVFVKQITA